MHGGNSVKGTSGSEFISAYEESFHAKLEESGDVKISTGHAEVVEAVNIKAGDSVSSAGSAGSIFIESGYGKISISGKASSKFFTSALSVAHNELFGFA